ncbi:MAG: chloramphenicol acetyltransferase [Methanobrevibacter arboriphilus]|uniref:Chloramphenicol acetyltransferase n=2 Tax=Methanobrevibacter arboriphilus TaxID=39441 RepID=A0A843AST1_METAZ|nr:chloramphenicol acetyltransferase [Methanobrevibacter arboriphilus]
MKELDFNIKESPFSDFFTSRFSMSFRIDVQNAWEYSEDNNLSFFILSLGCLLCGLNSIPELRRRIINGKAFEFDKIDAVTPIMDEDESVFEEMRVSPPKESESLKNWHDNVVGIRDSILEGKVSGFSIETTKRDSEPIANFSCIPWVDFDTLVNCISEPHQIQPLITWGRVSEDKEMPVAIAFSHIFVYGKHIGKFQYNTQEYFNKPNTL